MTDLITSLGEQGPYALLLAITLAALGWVVRLYTQIQDKRTEDLKEQNQTITELTLEAFKAAQTLDQALNFVKSKGGQ